MGDERNSSQRGRPRSESARRAVLEAVDDMLVEVGYAEMTMKGIAERAGVGRQTVYRWWTTKAEILLEACTADAHAALTTPPRVDAGDDLLRYLKALTRFLDTEAGLAYRALVGEAQHDPEVHELVVAGEIIEPTARAVLDRVRPGLPGMPDPRLSVAQFIGPVISTVLSAPAPITSRQLGTHVAGLLKAWA